MKIKTGLIAEGLALVAVAMAIGVMIVVGVHKRAEAKHTEPTCQATTQATAEETTEYITEYTQEETIATEPTTALYDVPLEEDLQIHIIETAEANGIDPAIIMAMAYRESTYRTDAIGDNGNSYGLLQVQPRHHYGRMQKLGCTDLLDPFQNVTVAVDYLVEKLERHGDMAKALTAYNKGHYPGYVTQYAHDVMAKATELQK